MSETVSTEQIENWLVSRVVAYGKVAENDFTVDSPLEDLGLDSVYALTLCGDVEDEFGIDVDPTIVWDHSTIRELAGGLHEKILAEAG